MSATATNAAATGESQYLHGFALIAATILLALANFMALLDMTIVNVAVPHIAGSLAVSPNEGTWVITSYAVAEAITVPLTGWLSSRFGSVRVFVCAVAFFGLFSMLCASASSLYMLVFFRILQGTAGGPLMPMSQTLIMRISPPRYTQLAIGLQVMTTIIAPIAGPFLGGTITDSIGWPWAFYINVPVSILCAVLAWRLLAPFGNNRVKQPVDYVGLGLLILWIGALQIMLDKGQEDDWFASPFIVTLAVIAVIGFIAFLIWEVTDAHPIVDLSVFRYRTFSVFAVAMALTFGAFFASIVLIPLWLQTNLNYTATDAGYVMAFQGMLGIAMAPVAAILVSRIDPRILMSTGLSILAGASLWRTTFAQDMTFWQLAVPQLMMGAGIPLFFLPLISLSVASVPTSKTASAAGLVHFIRTVSGAFGAALVTTAWTQSSTDVRVNLVGSLRRPERVLDALQSHGFSPNQALHMLGNLVDGQAVMVATNHLFLVLGLITAGVAAAVWLAPRPAAMNAAPAGMH